MRRALAGLAIGAIAGVLGWLGTRLAGLRLLGMVRDDGEYVAYALALLAGLGFVDPADPALAPAARYPIGYPALLALGFTGAGGMAGALARTQWLPALTAAAFVVLAYLWLRRAAGLAPGWALALAAGLAMAPALVTLASSVNSDVAFGCMAALAMLAGEPALRRGTKPAGWLGVGLLVGLAALVRTAGLALLPALAFAAWRHGRLREAWPALAGAALPLAAWSAYRAQLGGTAYQDMFRLTMPTTPAALADVGARATARLLGEALPGWVVPGLGGATLGPLAIVGALVGLAALAGAAAWAWRAPEAEGPSAYAPAFVLATAALGWAWTLGFLAIEPTLQSRLLLPAAPYLALCAARGFALVLRPAELPGWLPPRRLAAVGCGLVVLAAFLQLPRHLALTTPAARHLETLAAWRGLFAAVREQVPPGELVASKYHVMTWLHGGRGGWSWPAAYAGGGQVPLAPGDALRFVAERRVGWIAAAPAGPDEPNFTTHTLNPLARSFPTAFRPVWVHPRGDFALFAVDRGALADACKRAGLPPPVP